MRGSPPVQLAFLLVGFIAVGVPLVELTRGHAEGNSPAPAVAAAEAKRPVFVKLRYVTKPQRLIVKAGNEDVLAKTALAASEVEGRTAISFLADGFDLSVSAEWPAGTPDNVLTIEVEPDGLERRSQFLWSADGHIDDVLSFTWKP